MKILSGENWQKKKEKKKEMVFQKLSKENVSRRRAQSTKSNVLLYQDENQELTTPFGTTEVSSDCSGGVAEMTFWRGRDQNLIGVSSRQNGR